ncbi:hypothetical protein ACFOYW_08590 [Gryllotalpicola reticulitermitis]|uniref:Uncharacterized protein n=1 Tax=Gryllotalpicola reticulitermitis TaxID=1184153 RepID=A0ABV8Q8D5_9MICO
MFSATTTNRRTQPRAAAAGFVLAIALSVTTLVNPNAPRALTESVAASSRAAVTTIEAVGESARGLGPTIATLLGSDTTPAGREAPAAQKAAASALVKAIIAAVKKIGPSVWNAVVKAAKTSKAAVQKWWNNLAAWMRTAIRAVATWAITTILDEIYKYVRNGGK